MKTVSFQLASDGARIMFSAQHIIAIVEDKHVPGNSQILTSSGNAHIVQTSFLRAREDIEEALNDRC